MPRPNVQLRARRERAPSQIAPGEPMTRAELAEAVNRYLWESTGRRYQLDAHTIARYERGAVCWPSAHYRSGLRHVLSADSDAELGFHPTHRGNTCHPANEGAAAGAGEAHALGEISEQLLKPHPIEPPTYDERLHPEVSDQDTDIEIDYFMADLRRVLGRYDMPDDGPVRRIGRLRQATRQVVSWRLNSEYSQLARCLPGLISELTRAAFSAAGSARSELMSLLAQAYRAADAIADKFGFSDLSARTIELMRWAAGESGDDVTIGTASYVRAETFFATQQFGYGRQMLETAATELQLRSAYTQRAVYGALHMRAAVAAARNQHSSRANDHLVEASEVARHVPDGLYAGTAFGPSSVRIHRLTLALDLDDLGTAFALAAGWAPPETVPAERRSHYYIDVARAQHRAGRAAEALDALSVARELAPEHVRVHAQANAVTAALSTS